MNPHYHHPPYPDLNSPHSPNSDGVPSSYHGHGPMGGPPNGHILGPHHEHLHQHPAYVGGGHHGNAPSPLNNFHQHHHYHHFLNNNNSNSNNNNSQSGNYNNNNANNQNGSHVCVGCGNKIMDRFYLSMNEQAWHHNCLKCTACYRTLADLDRKCFTKDNMILCKKDYVRIFGLKADCSACGQTINATDMVQRTGGPTFASSPGNARPPHQVFHVSCFICVKCNNKLTPGDRYCMLANGNLVCEKDWQSLHKTSMMVSGQQPTTGTAVRKGKVGRPRRSRD